MVPHHSQCSLLHAHLSAPFAPAQVLSQGEALPFQILRETPSITATTSQGQEAL